MPDYSAACIADREGLLRLAPEWDELLGQSAADSIFLTWEWVSSWLDTVLPPSAALKVVAVRDQRQRLVALAPFYLVRFRLLGMISYRCLRVLGDCHSGGEYPDVIVRRGLETEVLPLVAGALLTSRDWDCAWIPNVAGWTGAFERWRVVFAEGTAFFRFRPSSFSTIFLPESWDAFLRRLSGNRRSALKRQENRALQSSAVVVEKCEDRQELTRRMEDLFALHAKRWGTVGQQGSFVRRPRMADFYRSFAPKALAVGWLGLFTLATEDAVRAVQYGYLYKNRYLQLQEGFDPDGPAGTGNVLRAEVIRRCIGQGVREYDFLGEHTDYKAKWGAEERSGWQIFLGRACLKNVFVALVKIWPSGRFIRWE